MKSGVPAIELQNDAYHSCRAISSGLSGRWGEWLRNVPCAMLRLKMDLSPDNYQIASRYLELTRLTNHIHVVGILDVGVTIRSQQVRALNLIWALDASGELRGCKKIAILGGGISGLTAGGALRRRLRDEGGCKIALFEKRSVLCPLQRGCDTRWVHPHAYEWPLEGSSNPSAGLPVFNWRAGRASDVAATLVKEWEELEKASGEALPCREIRSLRYLKMNAATLEIEWVGHEYSASLPQPARGGCEKFDLVIIATGYGQEEAGAAARDKSYWRNEAYGQPDLSGIPKRYLVSGTGDGGLIDLLRLCITDFRQDRTPGELVPHQFLPELREIRTHFHNVRGPTANASLFKACREFAERHKVLDELQKRLRPDTSVSLQIRRGSKVNNAFSSRSSFANRFFQSSLFAIGGFTPEFGDLTTFDEKDFDELIVRHGTNSDERLREVFTNSGRATAAINKLQRKLKDNTATTAVRYGERLWNPGWPFQSPTNTKPAAKRDYVPDATVVAATAFVSGLHSVLSRGQGTYRATLHRVWSFRDVSNNPSPIHLQQVAHYQGSRMDSAHEAQKAEPSVGRLFRVEDALIGLAARCRKILITRRPPGTKKDRYAKMLREDMEKLGSQHPNWDPAPMQPKVHSLLACPLLSADGRVTSVLFADSTGVDAFDEQCAANIAEACQGFGKYIESVVRNTTKEIRDVNAEATSYVSVDEHRSLALLGKLRTIRAAGHEPPVVHASYLNLEWGR
jgi:hypothetical protein